MTQIYIAAHKIYKTNTIFDLLCIYPLFLYNLYTIRLFYFNNKLFDIHNNLISLLISKFSFQFVSYICVCAFMQLCLYCNISANVGGYWCKTCTSPNCTEQSGNLFLIPGECPCNMTISVTNVDHQIQISASIIFNAYCIVHEFHFQTNWLYWLFIMSKRHLHKYTHTNIH